MPYNFSYGSAKMCVICGSSFNEGSMAWLKTGGLIKSVCAPTVLKDKHCRRHIPIMGFTGASGYRFVGVRMRL